MPELVLTTLRCPDSVPVEQRRVTSSEFRIGRGERCDWRLVDATRSLSKEHCVIEYDQGGWQVRDLSSNGTFVNGARQPVGQGNAVPLQSGDRLRIGPYEIELQASAGVQPPSSSAFSPDPFQPDPDFAPDAPRRLNPFEDVSFFGSPTPSPALPTAPADLTPEEFHAFTPPVVRPKSLDFPDDLDLSLDAPAPAVAQRPRPPSVPDQSFAPDDAFAPDRDFAPDNAFAPAKSSPRTQDSSPDPDFAPGPDFGPGPAVASDSRPAPFAQEPPAPPVVAAAIAPVAAASRGGGLDDLVAGAGLSVGLPDRVTAEPATALRTAGALLRRLTSGLRDLLIARNSVKQEFRIQQTVLHAAMNNPVKFAATDEQALAALLDPKTPALKAVDEALEDLVSHQLATLEATQAAARSLLERMDPESIEAEDPGGGLLPGAREKRLWEAYRKRHAKLVDDFNDDFDSAFGKAFARAYEEVTRGRDG